MINYLLHGDYQIASRQQLTSLISLAKQNQNEIIYLNGANLQLDNLIQASSANSFFGDKTTIVIENLFSQRKSKALEIIFAWLKKYAGPVPIIFWDKKTIGKVLQRNLPKNTQVKEFKTPALIFKLVEQLNPSTKPAALKLLQQTLINVPAELIFYMICRQIRQLILVKSSQPLKGAPWIIGKLKNQADAFNMNQLLKLYQNLYIIDQSIKTGQTMMPLEWHLTWWLSQI